MDETMSGELLVMYLVWIVAMLVTVAVALGGDE